MTSGPAADRYPADVTVEVPGGSAAQDRLFYEPGGRWHWLALGPMAGLVMYGLQLWTAGGPNPLLPLGAAVVVTFFVGLQIHAARMHASVELTPTHFRQGTETLPLTEIRCMYPDDGSLLWDDVRPLGDLSAVPKGRKSIGLRLSEDRYARAWAKRHRELRAALSELVPPPSKETHETPETEDR